MTPFRLAPYVLPYPDGVPTEAVEAAYVARQTALMDQFETDLLAHLELTSFPYARQLLALAWTFANDMNPGAELRQSNCQEPQADHLWLVVKALMLLAPLTRGEGPSDQPLPAMDPLDAYLDHPLYLQEGPDGPRGRPHTLTAIAEAVKEGVRAMPATVGAGSIKVWLIPSIDPDTGAVLRFRTVPRLTNIPPKEDGNA